MDPALHLGNIHLPEASRREEMVTLTAGPS